MEELDPEGQFLHHSRNGDLAGIKRLLMATIREETHININCKGKSKSNLGWTPLHLACYFGHKDVVEELLKSGADVNLSNSMGDTPLHKAAFTGRKEVVMLLLKFGACATVINGTAQIPKDVTQNAEIRSMLEAAERTEEMKLEEQLLESAGEGDVSTLTQLLSRKKPVRVSCTDLLGNTPLHRAACHGHKECALRLLRCGASPNSKNHCGQTVFDLACDLGMTQLLEGGVHRGMTQQVKTFRGLLWKRSRFFGWRSYWVVLQDGVLSWFSKQSDADANVRRQGVRSLTQARCSISAREKCVFTLRCFDDSVHHFKVSPKNHPEAARKAWLDALEEHSAFSTHYCSQDPGSEEEEESSVAYIAELAESLQSAQSSHRRMEEELEAFVALVVEEEGRTDRGIPCVLLQKLQELRVLSSETCCSLSAALGLLSSREAASSVLLQQERQKNRVLSEALQTLASEHHELERSVRHSTASGVASEEDFHDALSDSDSERSLSGFETAASRSFEEEEEEGEEEDEEASVLSSSSRSSSSTSMLQEDRHGNRESNGIVRHR